jgi:hypothetical protein
MFRAFPFAIAFVASAFSTIMPTEMLTVKLLHRREVRFLWISGQEQI